MPRLEHIFAAGLRFDAEIQYLALNQSRSRSRYAKLPVLKSGSAKVCGLTSVMQAVLILGQMPSRRLTPERKGLVTKALGEAAHPGALDILRCLRVMAKLSETELLKTASTVQAPAMGQTALQALRSGGVCLLHYASSGDTRWAMVTGVEVAVEGDKMLPRALLLLDSRASEPWACAHNVRIELQPNRGRNDGVPLVYPLVCRHLTGEASRVRLLRLISLKQPAPTK